MEARDRSWRPALRFDPIHVARSLYLPGTTSGTAGAYGVRRPTPGVAPLSAQPPAVSLLDDLGALPAASAGPAAVVPEVTPADPLVDLLGLPTGNPGHVYPLPGGATVMMTQGGVVEQPAVDPLASGLDLLFSVPQPAVAPLQPAAFPPMQQANMGAFPLLKGRRGLFQHKVLLPSRCTSRGHAAQRHDGQPAPSGLAAGKQPVEGPFRRPALGIELCKSGCKIGSANRNRSEPRKRKGTSSREVLLAV